MLTAHATWEDGGNSVEMGVMELYQAMTEGRFKVFRHLKPWFEEKMNYHRDEKGKIVKVGDDLLDATRYGWMMRRHAVQLAQLLHSNDDVYNEVDMRTRDSATGY